MGQRGVPERERWWLAVDAAAVLLCVLVFWLPIGGGPVWLTAAHVTAVLLVAAGTLLRFRWPLRAFAVVAGTTLAGLLLGVTREPFLLSAWILYEVALLRGETRRLPKVLLASFAAVTVLATVSGSDHVLDLLRYLLVSGLALLGAWTLGSVTRQKRLEAEHAARAERERAVAAERLRVVRELHDVVSHSLGTIAIVSGTGRHSTTDDPAALREKLATIEETSRAALDDMRSVLGVLRADAGPGERAPQPGLDDLDALVARAERAGTPTTLTVTGSRPLPAGTQRAVYRIVQEGLTNAVRHAPGARCAVTVATAGEQVDVEVVNDPPARRPRPGDAPGFGLVGLRERVELLGGEFTAGKRPDGGFALRVRLPADPHGREAA